MRYYPSPPRRPNHPEEPAIPDHIYLYLARPEFVKAWTKGGSIPIAPASRYLGNREGVNTPDEVSVVQTWGVRGAEELIVCEAAKMAGLNNVRFEGIAFEVGGELFPIKSATVHVEARDSLILSFSKSLSRELAVRMGKVAVVEIVDPYALAVVIGNQIGVETVFKRVLYTASPRRDCFLKDLDDQWQHEVRMAWFVDDLTERWVELPPGVAVEIPFDTVRKKASPPDCLLEADYDRYREAEDQFWQDVGEWQRYEREMSQAPMPAPPRMKTIPPLESLPGAVAANRKDRRMQAKLARKNRPRGGR